MSFEEKSALIAALRAKGAPVSYELCIDEAQRLALLDVLKGDDQSHGLPEALEYWIAMLEGLPSVEAESPGILHGFCL